MRKLILLAALFCSLSALGQSYTYIGQRYEWLAGMFRALSLPGGDGPAAFQPGQRVNQTAVYVDTAGVDAGVYRWNGSAWELIGGNGRFGVSGEDDAATQTRSFNSSGFPFQIVSDNNDIDFYNSDPGNWLNRFILQGDGNTLWESSYISQSRISLANGIRLWNSNRNYWIDSLADITGFTAGAKAVIWDTASNQLYVAPFSEIAGTPTFEQVLTEGPDLTNPHRVALDPGDGILWHATNPGVDSIVQQHTAALWRVQWGNNIANTNSLYLDATGAAIQAVNGVAGHGGRLRIDAFDVMDGATYEDFDGTPTGIKYAGDYSGSFVNRSLVDKEYVDNAVSGVTVSAGEGLKTEHGQIRLGGGLADPAKIYLARAIDLNRRTLYLTSGAYAMDTANDGNTPFVVATVDTMASNEPDIDELSGYHTAFKRIIRVTGPYHASYRTGHLKQLEYQNGDSTGITTNGGDFGNAFTSRLVPTYLPEKTTGRIVWRGGSVDFEAPASSVSLFEPTGSNGGRHMLLRGWWAGHTSYLRMYAAPDTLERFMFYNTTGYIESGSKILKMYNYYANSSSGDSSWGYYSPLAGNRFYHYGSAVFGPGGYSSNYRLKVQGTTYVSDSVTTALRIAQSDTTGIDFIVRDRTTGLHKHIRADQIGVGGGSTPVSYIIAASDETTDITTGTAKVTFRMPHAMTVTSVRASLGTTSSSGLPEVNIKESGVTILSTKITIDVGEKTSTTAATPPVISDASLADDAEITIDIDTAGTGAKGLKIIISGTR